MKEQPLDNIRAVAHRTAVGFKLNQISLPALAAALLQHEDIRSFLIAQNVDPIIIEREHNFVLADQQHRLFIPTSDLQYSEDVQELLSKTELILQDKRPVLNNLGPLVALYFLLGDHPNSPSAKILQDCDIDTNCIDQYLTNVNKHARIKKQKSNALALPEYERTMVKDENSAIMNYTTSLNDASYDGTLPPVIGREQEIQKVLRILRRRSKNNPILLGEEGVGKTAIAEGLAHMAVRGELPSDLKNLKIFSLDMGEIVAGTTYRGQFETRIKDLVSELADHEQAILFVDEFHGLIGLGRASGTQDASSILKPALARGQLTILGATTYKEYRKFVEKDPAFARRFNPVDVAEPTREETLEILQGIKHTFERHHHCVITDDALQTAIKMSGRYITNRRFPDKAIDIIDEAGALTMELPWDEMDFHEGKMHPMVTPDIVAKAVSLNTGFPVDSLTTSERQKILSLKPKLKGVIYGQDEAINEVSDKCILARSGIEDEERPIANFLFTGPTGVGKTELSKQLADILDIDFIRIDMSEYMEKHSVSGLIGAKPGYVGYDEGGVLTSQVDQKPYCVLLLDEIEKAHPDVHNILLQVMDHGKLRDSSGKTIDFKNVILIMTTNAGAGGSVIHEMGFGRDGTRDSKDGDIERTFTPEFRNRLDAIVTFKALEPEIMSRMVNDLVTSLQQTMTERGMTLDVKEDAIAWLSEEGFDEKMGGRPLRRVFAKSVKQPIAEYLIEKDEAAGTRIVVSTKDGKLDISFESATNDSGSGQDTGTELTAERPDLPVFIRGVRASESHIK